MSTILLSIRPEYVGNILDGTKKYEYRKRLANNNVKFIYIYSTYPVMKVVAKVEITGVLYASPTALWERTKRAAGISRQTYRNYFKGCKTAYAYQLGSIETFSSPKELQDFGVTIAPQSFVYINDDVIQRDKQDANDI